MKGEGEMPYMVRVGVVGVGGIASAHLKNLSEDERVELVAVCDIDASQAERVGAQYGAIPYTDSERLLENERLDALFICVPPFAHGDIEEKAAAKGIHLMVEKPIALDMATAQKKAAAIRQAGILAATGYCLRYLDAAQRAKDYLADKTIAMIRGYYLSGFVPTPWWREMSKSGGQLVEQATHTVDMMRYLGGDVSKVSADMALRVMHDIERNSIPDVGSINVVFTSGAVGHLDVSYTQPDHRSGIEILGRDFRIVIDGSSFTIVEKDVTTTYNHAVDVYREQDRAFIDAIEANDSSPILAPYDEGLKTLAVTLAANESADTGKPIFL